ncbi:MAG: hypothetical protein AAFU67_16060, partial [Bacteroidota bacterium]
DDMLRQAATRTFDRTYLYDLLQQLEQEGLDGLGLMEEKLELEEIDNLEFEFAPTPTPPKQVKAREVENEKPIFEFNLPDSTEDEPADDSPILETELPPLPLEDESVDATIEDVETPTEISVELEVDTSSPVDEVVEEPDAEVGEEDSIPVDVSNEATDTDIDAPQLTPPATSPLAERLRRHRRRQVAELGKDKPENDADSLSKSARESVKEHQEIASETLAKLLVQQEQYEKAIKMYQRLSLLYPKKKAIFAGLIKELKEKL